MSDVVFFFSGWEPLLRILVIGILTYMALVLVLRISGSRSLASMNAFDFIVTVAIGAVFGRALTAKTVALAEVLTALILLVALQFAVAWLQTRWTFFMGVLTNPPALLYHRGQFLRDAMRRERVTEAEIEAAVRKKELGSMAEVEAVVLESSGEFSVIASLGDGSALGKSIQDEIARRTSTDPEPRRPR
jgi:uncharacterized membrane protein YcaP (DUF421 family)